jgi:uncharacterized alkaline shock family protein YloU
MIAHGPRPPTGNGRRPGAGPTGPVEPQVEDGAVPSSSVPGHSYVTRRAIVEVVRTAALGSYGVTGLSEPHVAQRALRRLGLATPGVQVTLQPALGIELFLTVAYGLPVAEVVRQVDSAVRHALRRALDREVVSLVVHVNGLRESSITLPPVAIAASSVSAAPVLDVVEEPADDVKAAARPAGAVRRRRPAAGSQSAAPH